MFVLQKSQKVPISEESSCIRNKDETNSLCVVSSWMNCCGGELTFLLVLLQSAGPVNMSPSLTQIVWAVWQGI